MDMTKGEIIIIAIYLIGLFLSYWMLKTEHESEEKPWTNKDKILLFLFSILSMLTVITMLISTWFAKIGKTGYWDKPVKQTSK